MASIQFDFFSRTLGLSSQLNIVFSQGIKERFGKDHKSPVLYLLHGLSGDHTSWCRRSSIERYVEGYDLIVVMPAVHRSFYRNTHAGHRYFDYVSEELPELCRSFFPISEARESTFVAGNSMGGYGAFKLALSKPQHYGAAASLSGALHLAALDEQRDELLPEWSSVFGPDPKIAGSDDDLLHLASQLAVSGAPMPELFQCCGTEDYLYPANQSFRAHAAEKKLPLHFEEGPAGHDWTYWDQKIQDVLRWLPLRKLEN